MKANRAEFGVAVMCRVLGVSTSGYYSWRGRGPSARARRDAELTGRIVELHAESDGVYGAPRILEDLKAEGEATSRKRVARLMSEAGIAGVTRRRFKRTTRPDDRAEPAPDLVERDFSADRPDRLWVADATYIPTLEGFLYLAVVLDVFSRRIVGWSMGQRLVAGLMTGALDMAVSRRDARGAVHHSDRGSQYTSAAFGARCRAAGVSISMGSVGDCHDNAMCESFFATLECELIGRRRFQTRDEAGLAVFEFIEGFYNRRRRHSSIGHVSPVVFEERHAVAFDQKEAA